MTAAARAVFAALLLATFGAFFVTQRLKNEPRVVRTLSLTNLFSPNGDKRREEATIRFRLESRSDDVSVTIIDSADDTVRRLVRERHVPAERKLRFTWDGRDDAGRVVPDGSYRVRIGLRKQGRSAILVKSIRLDTTPPRPVVQVVNPAGTRAPLVVAPGTLVRFRYLGGSAPKRLAPRFVVYRSDLNPPRIVARLVGARGSRSAVWDGLVAARPAEPGTYFVAARVRDRASNTGTSPPLRPAARGAPPSRPGITVRGLAVQPPSVPVSGGARARFFVDARGQSYRWRIRRVGATRGRARFRTVRSPVLSVFAPRGTGVYLMEVRTKLRRATVPFAVQGRARHPILLVLPVISWQGRNMIDDDGNGLPNTLVEIGLPNSPGVDDTRSRVDRVFAGAGLPEGFRSNEGPLLAFLDRAGLRYDVTTDVALQQDLSPLERHRGIVLAGLPRWVTPLLRERLRKRLAAGGRVLELGTGILRRGVLLDHGAVYNPSHEAASDIFGIRPATLVNKRKQLLAFPGDELGLFAGTDGLFASFDSSEPIASSGADAETASAAGADDGRAVIAALRYAGKGLIIRTGLPQWSVRLRDDANAQALTSRAWTLLAR